MSSTAPLPPPSDSDLKESSEAAMAMLSETTGAGPSKAEKPPSLLSYPATYFLIGINLLVFAWMFPTGPVPELWRAHAWTSILTASFDPNEITRFGGSFSVDVLEYHQWWRLLTSCFVHVTLLHLLLNMWCLWNLGVFGEPLLGRPGLVAVYVLTGIAGMMLSLAWTVFEGQTGLVAGASGAVFGIAGILIVLLSNRKLSLPWNELRSLRRQVVFFAVANLAIGLAPNFAGMLSPEKLDRLMINPAFLPHIDNTAHLGGCACGLALGLPLFPRMTSGKSSYRARQRGTFLAAAFVLGLLGYALAAFAH